MKFSKPEDRWEKLLWDSNQLSRKRKEKKEVWEEFVIIPNMENYQSALNKQNEYEKLEVDEKL